MNLLIALLFSKTIKRAADPRRVARGVRKEIKFLVILITEIVQAIQRLIRFIISTVKHIRKSATVDEVKLPENVISFSDYKFKKAN